MKQKLLFLISVAIIFISSGCSSDSETNKEPLPVDNPRDTSIYYLVKAPFDHLKKESIVTLQKRYTLKKLREDKISHNTHFWHLNTHYSFIEPNDKKHRSKCSVHLHSFLEYPSYTSISVSCRLETYAIGFTRAGIHSLLRFWRDWYPDQGLYLTKEVIDEVMKRGKINENNIIKLRRMEYHDDVLKIISDHEKKQA